MNPLELPNLAAWYDLALPASTTSNDIRIDASNRVSLIADKSGNSATNCLCLNGAANQGATSPDSAATSITGDLDLRVWMAPDSWTPSANQVPLSKYNTSSGNHRSYWLRHRTTGALDITWSADGVSAVTALSTATISAATFSRLWVRATLDVDNGAGGWTVRFFTSSDGVTWTQLGADVTGVGVTSIFDGPATVNIGGNDALAFGNFTGKIFRAQIYNGIAGTLVFDANFATASKLATSFTESSSNAATVTINSSGDLGARISGERDLVQLTASKQPIYLPWSGTNYCYLNGVGGNWIDTPDAAKYTPTSTLRAEVFGITADWTPSATRTLAAKHWAQFSWIFELRTNGAVQLRYSTTGASFNTTIAQSSSFPSFTDGGFGGLAFELNVTNGNVSFFSSTNGSTWTLMQTVAGAGAVSLFDSTDPIEFFSDQKGGGARLAGNLYRGRVLVDGVAVADFNPSLYTSGTTFTASTGEAWTLNGGVTIVNRTSVYFDGSDDYMKAAAFSLSQPETVYFVGQQVSWTLSDVFFDGGSTNGGLVYQRASTPNLGMFAGTDVGTNGNLAVGTNGLVSAVFNGASSSLRVNRTAAVTGNCGANNPNGFTLGVTANGASGPSNIRTNEVCIYAAAHDTSVQDRVIQYAGRKWGISGV